LKSRLEDLGAWLFIFGLLVLFLCSPLPSIIGLLETSGILVFYGVIFGSISLVCGVFFLFFYPGLVRRKRIEGIEREIERKSFDKALQIVARCIRDCEGSFEEAYFSYTRARILLRKHLGSLSSSAYKEAKNSSAYKEAKNYLNNSLMLYSFLGTENKKARTNSARVLLDLGFLEFLVGNFGASLRAYKESLGIYEEYGIVEGVKAVTKMIAFAEMQRAVLDIQNVVNLWLKHKHRSGKYII